MNILQHCGEARPTREGGEIRENIGGGPSREGGEVKGKIG